MRIFGFIILFLATSCNIKQEKITVKDRCLSQSTLYLYSSINEDYIPVFNAWSNNLDSTDSRFVLDLIEIIDLIKPLTGNLINQAGGVHPTDYVLMNPCKTGGSVVDEIFNDSLKVNLKDKMGHIKTIYSNDKYEVIISLFDNSLQNYFYGSNPFFDKEHISNTSYSKLCMELLVLEQNLYLFMHKNLNGSISN